MHSTRTLMVAVLAALAILASAIPASAQPLQLRPEARDQIRRLIEEKAARGPIVGKIGSQLLYAMRMQRGQDAAPGVSFLHVDLDRDSSGRVLVDVAVAEGVDLTARIQSMDGRITRSLPDRGALRAYLPLDSLVSLAAHPEVRSIKPAARAMTRKIDTSEGDLRHGGPSLRSALGVDGTGISVGVLSDGVDSLASLQASGDISATTTVLSGQAGSGDEGSAMLEIVHDLAPGATLLFATAFDGQASFAANIVALRDAGADVIVDDVGYFAESVFQDDDVAEAVDIVTADGALYFSSAGNSGNLNDGTAGVYEGDFVADASTVLGGSPHDYGGGVIFNEILEGSPFAYSLHWSDPNGGSANDYDLYMLNKPGSVIFAASTDIQDGDDDPFELIGVTPNDRGNNLLIVRTAGADRMLHLNANRGRIEFATDGQTSGHSSARDAFSVAAVDARIGTGSFDGSESVQTYSSDGPRRIFYNADGSAITPGVFDSTGGEVRQKPDIAAADCVSTASPGFSTFCGTSAAAPHAAALAALLLEALPSATPATIRTALTSSAFDIEAISVDRDSGAGLVFGPAAGAALPECVVDADCDDGNYCSGVEVCDAGVCLSGPGDPCTGGPAPFCDESADVCLECQIDSDCDDDAFCTGTETCSAGSCNAGPGDPCIGGPDPFCDEAADLCVACFFDGDCGDGLFCNGVESCVAGACAPGPGDPCMGGPDPFCDDALDVCLGCLIDGDCDDATFCNGVESCVAGACQPGSGDPCAATSDPFCDEGSNACFECSVDADCQDGIFCNGAETCDGGACNAPSMLACPDAEAPICLEAETICVECQVNTDCGGGQACEAGVCVAQVPAAADARPWIVAVLALGGAWILRKQRNRWNERSRQLS